MTNEEIIEFFETKKQLEPENKDIYDTTIKVLKAQPKWIPLSEELPDLFTTEGNIDDTM